MFPHPQTIHVVKELQRHEVLAEAAIGHRAANLPRPHTQRLRGGAQGREREVACGDHEAPLRRTRPMAATWFNDVLRNISANVSRCGLLAGLTSGILAALPFINVDRRITRWFGCSQ